VLAAAVVPFVVAAPGGVWDAVSRQLSRPLQIESLGSAVSILAHHLAGLDVDVVTSHGSQNVGGSLGETAGAVSSLLQIGIVAVLWVAFARGAMEPERFLRYSAAVVVAFVAFGKVLSPQFLIWLLPLVPLVRGRRGLTASAVLAAALVVTQIWFPYRYWELPDELDPTVASLVLLRDVLLVGLLLVLVRPERGEVTRWVEEARTTWDGQPVSREKPHGVAVLVWRSAPSGREWLVLHRAHQGPEYAGDWAWGPPAGARHPGEDVDECARRELEEEAGLVAVPERTECGTAEWAVYVAEAPAGAAVTLSDEHDRFEWLPLGSAVRRCVPPRVGRDFRAVAALLDRR
jgi:8-oxo-dGTP pyrophosphatase MutT (NUDIX family)